MTTDSNFIGAPTIPVGGDTHPTGDGPVSIQFASGGQAPPENDTGQYPATQSGTAVKRGGAQSARTHCGPARTEPSSRSTVVGSGEAGLSSLAAVALTVLPPPKPAPVPGTEASPSAATAAGEGAAATATRAHRNPTHHRKGERSHAHDHWHFARVPQSHLPADLSQQWWMETKAMIDRGYDRFIARHHLDRHSPEWSVSNWGVCAGVSMNEKP